MGRLQHIFLSYCKSHIYELHAILAAVITFFVMFPIKRPIKRMTKQYVEKKAKENEKWEKNRRLYQKRCNMLVLITALAVAMLVFTILSMVSPFIHFSFYTGVLSGAFTLALYALYDQVIGKRRQSI